MVRSASRSSKRLIKLATKVDDGGDVMVNAARQLSYKKSEKKYFFFDGFATFQSLVINQLSMFVLAVQYLIWYGDFPEDFVEYVFLKRCPRHLCSRFFPPAAQASRNRSVGQIRGVFRDLRITNRDLSIIRIFPRLVFGYINADVCN